MGDALPIMRLRVVLTVCLPLFMCKREARGAASTQTCPSSTLDAVQRFNSRYKNANVELVWDKGQQRSVPRARRIIKKGSNIVAMPATEVLTGREAERALFHKQNRLTKLKAALQRMPPEQAGG